MHLSEAREKAVRAFSSRRRIAIVVTVLALMIALPISYRTFKERRAEAQNPMGDSATAASDAAEDLENPPGDAPPAVAPVVSTFGSTASEAAACLARHQDGIKTAAAELRADSTPP